MSVIYEDRWHDEIEKLDNNHERIPAGTEKGEGGYYNTKAYV